MEIKQYIKENEARFMEELFSLIRITRSMEEINRNKRQIYKRIAIFAYIYDRI